MYSQRASNLWVSHVLWSRMVFTRCALFITGPKLAMMNLLNARSRRCAPSEFKKHVVLAPRLTLQAACTLKSLVLSCEGHHLPPRSTACLPVMQYALHQHPHKIGLVYQAKKRRLDEPHASAEPVRHPKRHASSRIAMRLHTPQAADDDYGVQIGQAQPCRGMGSLV